VGEAIVESADGWLLVGEACRVDQIQVDYRFALVLVGGTVLTVEQPFDLLLDGVVTRVDPETLDGVGGALGVLHREVGAVRARRSGGLTVELVDGGRLDVAPDDRFESWQVNCSDGHLLVGLPGGDVAVFPPGG
jgi:hypothetical protein